MSKKQPWEYHTGLERSRLNIIAKALLDVYHSTQDDLCTPLDNNYTRGTTTFGRQRERLIQLCRDTANADWLDLRNTSLDLTFAISNIPCRFFTDDHEKPQKRGFWKRNEQDNLFPTEIETPVYWRFVVEKPISDDDNASVYFLGANSNQEVVCEWEYADYVRVLRSVDETRHDEVNIQEPVVSVPKQRKNEEENTGSGS